MVKGVLTSLKNWLLLAKNSIVVLFFFLSFFFILVGVDCLLFISHCRVNDLEFWLSNTLTKTTTVTCLCSYLVMSIYCSIELWIKVMFFWVCFVFHYVSYLFLLVCPASACHPQLFFGFVQWPMLEARLLHVFLNMRLWWEDKLNKVMHVLMSCVCVFLEYSLTLFVNIMSCQWGAQTIHVLRLLVHVLGICYCCCKTIRWFCQ